MTEIDQLMLEYLVCLSGYFDTVYSHKSIKCLNCECTCISISMVTLRFEPGTYHCMCCCVINQATESYIFT